MCDLVSPELHSPAQPTNPEKTIPEDRKTPGCNSTITIITIIITTDHVQLRSYTSYIYVFSHKAEPYYIKTLITLSFSRYSYLFQLSPNN